MCILFLWLLILYTNFYICKWKKKVSNTWLSIKRNCRLWSLVNLFYIFLHNRAAIFLNILLFVRLSAWVYKLYSWCFVFYNIMNVIIWSFFFSAFHGKLLFSNSTSIMELDVATLNITELVAYNTSYAYDMAYHNKYLYFQLRRSDYNTITRYVNNYHLI